MMLDFESAFDSVLQIQSRHLDWHDPLSEKIHAMMGETLQKAVVQAKEAEDAKVEAIAREWFDQLAALFADLVDPWLVGDAVYEKIEVDQKKESYPIGELTDCKAHTFAKEVLVELSKLFKQKELAVAVVNPLRLQILDQKLETALYCKELAIATEQVGALNERLDTQLAEMERVRGEIVILEEKRQTLIQQALEETVQKQADQFSALAGQLEGKIKELKVHVDSLNSSLHRAHEASAAMQAQLAHKQEALVKAQSEVRIEVRETIRYVKKKSSGCAIM